MISALDIRRGHRPHFPISTPTAIRDNQISAYSRFLRLWKYMCSKAFFSSLDMGTKTFGRHLTFDPVYISKKASPYCILFMNRFKVRCQALGTDGLWMRPSDLLGRGYSSNWFSFPAGGLISRQCTLLINGDLEGWSAHSWSRIVCPCMGHPSERKRNGRSIQSCMGYSVSHMNLAGGLGRPVRRCGSGQPCFWDEEN